MWMKLRKTLWCGSAALMLLTAASAPYAPAAPFLAGAATFLLAMAVLA